MAEDKEKTLQFIEDYKSYQVLWDQNHKDYTNKAQRNDALTALGQKHNFDTKMVKNKIKSIRSYFSKEHQKVVSRKIVPDAEESYQSPWFAYNSLLFLLDSKEPSDVTEDENVEFHIAPPPVFQDKHEFVQPIQVKRSINKVTRDENQQEPYKIMKIATEDTDNRDECTIFAELIANKLRNLDRRNRLLAQHRIYNIFIDLELDEIDGSPIPMNAVFSGVPPPEYSPEASTSTQSEYNLVDDDNDSKSNIEIF